MTPREILIVCSARKMLDGGMRDSEVSAVVDDETRTANKAIRDYYGALSERGLKMLDKAVLKRLNYLRSIIAAKLFNDSIMPLINKLSKSEQSVMAHAVVYPCADYVAENSGGYYEQEEYITFEKRLSKEH